MKYTIIQKVGVIGNGSWGTALGNLFGQNADVIIWGRRPEIADSINQKHINEHYLPDIKLSENITGTTDFTALKDSELILLVVPAQRMRSICTKLLEIDLAGNIPIIICSKGIEQNTQKLLTEVISEFFPENPLCVLSGPNFAKEVAAGLPTATSLASLDIDLANNIAKQFSTNSFRIYCSNDIITTQISGAAKNVLAIACGIIIGRGLGENAKSAIITRGIHEISKLCEAKGGQKDALLGLAGIGDINLTCNSPTSRNTTFGIAIGKGEDLEKILAEKVVEGYYSSLSINNLRKELGVDMPICESIYKIVHQSAKMDDVINDLLNRPLPA